MQTRVRIAVMLAGLVAGVAIAPSANAGDGGADRHRTNFVIRGPAPALGAPFCDAEQRCLYPGTRATTYEGDWVGTGIAAGAAAANTDARFISSQTWLFAGSIEECGSGTLVLSVQETGDGPSMSGEGTWRIVPGFGTGDLTEVSGRGTGTGSASEGSRIKGLIRCSQ
jgi:hypothetical protein